MTYRYLYQDRENRNHEGEIKAKDRAEADQLLRKQGIRPYRVIGDDPWNWRPWAIAAGYAALVAAVIVMAGMVVDKGEANRQVTNQTMTAEEAARFREKAEEAVYRAPEIFREDVWRGVNARLIERGLEPLEHP